MDSFFVYKAFQTYNNLMSSSGVRCCEAVLGTVVLSSVSRFHGDSLSSVHLTVKCTCVCREPVLDLAIVQGDVGGLL